MVAAYGWWFLRTGQGIQFYYSEYLRGEGVEESTQKLQNSPPNGFQASGFSGTQESIPKQNGNTEGCLRPDCT